MQIQTKTTTQFSLSRPKDSADVEYRLRLLNDWMKKNNHNIFTANLAEFRDAMLDEGYAKRSIQAMLSTCRERMRDLIRSNDFVNDVKQIMWEQNQDLSPADLELQLQAILRQVENNADPRNSRLKDTIRQDKMDDERIWLNGQPMDHLLDQIGDGKHPDVAIRDRAMVALFFATGIRREELRDLYCEDIYKSFQNEPALLVRAGKGNKQRAVPYGALWERFVEPYVLPWYKLAYAPSAFKEDIYLFRAFWRGYEKLRKTPLNVGSINDILMEQKLQVDGAWIHVTPHQLRRTYARMLFQDYGVSTEGIQQNMGHAQMRTTQDYIGILDISFRTP